MKKGDKIRKLIADYRLEDALSSMLNIVENRDVNLRNQVILTKARQKDFRNDVHLGLKEKDNERQQIIFSCLNILDEIEQVINIDDDEDNRNQITVIGETEIVTVIFAYVYGQMTGNHALSNAVLYNEDEDEEDFILSFAINSFLGIESSNLNYEIYKVEVIERSSDEALARAIIKTTNKYDDEDNFFSRPNNIMTTIFYLKKDYEGFWKIAGSKVEGINYIE